MQLDRTHVTIRVRTLSEIGDLALLMIRRYPHAFFHAFFSGAAVWILANALLLGWLPWVFFDESLFESDATGEWFRYAFWMFTLVFLQTPIAGILTTYSLGQSIFERQPSLRKTLREIRTMLWPVVWVLGIKRLAIPAMLIVALRWNQPYSPFFDIVLPICFLIVAALIRSHRPFVGEMILLERCPLKSKQEGVITLAKRSRALHTPLASELGGRFLTVSMTFTALAFCLFLALVWVRGIAIGNWSADMIAMQIFYPLTLWLIASFSVVVRLLNYLDARIRLEGWEVELAIRAEAIRQFGEDFMAVPLKKPNSPVATAKVLSLLAFAFLFSGLPSASAAAPDTDAPIVSDSVWFDAETGSLRPIELEENPVDAENRNSRWLPTPPKPPAPANPNAATSTSWYSDISIWNVIGWLILLIVVVGLAALVMYLFANSSFDFRPDPLKQSLVPSRSLDEQTKQRIAELPAELRDTNVNPRAELERLMKLGDFGRAIIFLYGHQLLLLDRVGYLRLSRWKTNNQYVRETRLSNVPIGDKLNQTVKAFERSYFGKHTISRETFEVLWQENLVIEQTVSGTPQVAIS